jgi:hypothetical protein
MGPMVCANQRWETRLADATLPPLARHRASPFKWLLIFSLQFVTLYVGNFIVTECYWTIRGLPKQLINIYWVDPYALVADGLLILLGLVVLRLSVFLLSQQPSWARSVIPMIFYPLSRSDSTIQSICQSPATYIEAKSLIASNLNERIYRLRFRSAAILAFIAVSLIAAAIIIIIAGNLTGLDVNAVSNVDKLQSVINEASFRLVNLQNLAAVPMKS